MEGQAHLGSLCGELGFVWRAQERGNHLVQSVECAERGGEGGGQDRQVQISGRKVWSVWRGHKYTSVNAGLILTSDYITCSSCST